MKRQLIADIIYIEMSDELGPNTVARLGNQFTQMELIQISIKTLTILTGENGLYQKI